MIYKCKNLSQLEMFKNFQFEILLLHLVKLIFYLFIVCNFRLQLCGELATLFDMRLTFKRAKRQTPKSKTCKYFKHPVVVVNFFWYARYVRTHTHIHTLSQLWRYPSLSLSLWLSCYLAHCWVYKLTHCRVLQLCHAVCYAFFKHSFLYLNCIFVLFRYVYLWFI